MPCLQDRTLKKPKPVLPLRVVAGAKQWTKPNYNHRLYKGHKNITAGILLIGFKRVTAKQRNRLPHIAWCLAHKCLEGNESADWPSRSLKNRVTKKTSTPFHETNLTESALKEERLERSTLLKPYIGSNTHEAHILRRNRNTCSQKYRLVRAYVPRHF